MCVTERRTALDFAQQLKSLVAAYPEATQIVLVTDNLNTHTPIRWQFTTSDARIKLRKLYPQTQ